ncbi:SsrA-binding protein SmpB [Spirochaetota bacterium]
MGIKIITQNKKAYHDYFVEETIEAGISLVGTEVKSLREGKATISDGYAMFNNKRDLFLRNTHITEYKYGNINNHDALRPRQLLLHRRELKQLFIKKEQRGYTLIPLKLYFKGSLVKVEIGLCRGKRQYDKRDALRKKESKKRMEKILKTRR